MNKMRLKLSHIYNDFVKFPLYILTHPIAGFGRMKYEKEGKMSVAIVFILLSCLLRILQYLYTGFLVNDNDPTQLNSLKESSYVIGTIFLFTVGNWSITTLFDGKGNYKEILMMVSYSLFPLLLIGFPNILLSNVLTLNEISFYSLLQGLAVFLTGFLIFIGLIVVHEYSLIRTVFTVIATFMAIGVLLFILLLFFSLAQQIIAFIMGLYQEITWRYF